MGFKSHNVDESQLLPFWFGNSQLALSGFFAPFLSLVGGSVTSLIESVMLTLSSSSIWVIALHCYFECTIKNIDVSVDYSHGLKCVLRSVVEFLAFAPGTIWLDLSPAHWTGSIWGHFLTSTSFLATFTTQWYSCCIVRLQQSVGLHICWLLSYSWRDPGKKVTASTCSWRQFNSDAQTMFVFGKGNAIGSLSKGRGWWGWKRLLVMMLSYKERSRQGRWLPAICSQFNLTLPKNLQFSMHFDAQRPAILNSLWHPKTAILNSPWCTKPAILNSLWRPKTCNSEFTVTPKNLQFSIHSDAQKPAILNCPRLPWS